MTTKKKAQVAKDAGIAPNPPKTVEVKKLNERIEKLTEFVKQCADTLKNLEHQFIQTDRKKFAAEVTIRELQDLCKE